MKTLEVSGSGHSLVSPDGATYAEAHDASSGYYNEIQFIIGSGYYTGPTNYYLVQRGFIMINTASLGPKARIRSAVLTIVVLGYNNSLFHIVQGLDNGWNVSANFGLLKDKVVSGGSGSGSGSVSISLNAIGRSWINKVGITNLGLRIAGDIDNVIPTEIEYFTFSSIALSIEYFLLAGNPIIDQLIYQHAERMT